MSNLLGDFFGLSIIHGLRFGVELEYEQVAKVHDYPFGCRSVVEDGSLRNGGQEFVSNPNTKNDTLTFFKSVTTSKHVSWMEPSLRCTERGSVHVHVNMTHREVQDVRNLILLYCLLEPGFFDYVDDSRKNNIYCVNLSSTRMPQLAVKRGLMYLPEPWHKYTAFNVKPLQAQGTIEFRHLQATDDFEVFSKWLDIIERWFDLTADAETLTRDQLFEIYNTVFLSAPTPEVAAQLDSNLLAMRIAQQDFSEELITQRIKELKKCAA